MTLLRRTLLLALAGFSAVTTLCGFLALTAFDQAPGQALAAPAKWPESTTLAWSKNRPQLLVFVHPRCSCTGATITELSQLTVMPRGTEMPEITFISALPLSDAGWKNSTWLASARRLPGATVVWDARGRETKRFGANTSGYVLLYSSSGDLLFEGGVTGSRSHEGDNYGLSALLTAIRDNGKSGTRRSMVFGCSLTAMPVRESGKI